MVPDDTESLISCASQGDDAAIDALLERHLASLRAYIRLRMGPRVRRWDTEEDLAQSVCREALENLGGFTYRGEAAFRHWLFTMARRKLADRDEYLGAEKRDVDRVITNADGIHSIAREVHAAFGTPSELAIRAETLARIEEALDEMPDESREVLLMSRLAGLSTLAIAEKLGQKPSSVRSTLSRALARLSRALA
jgi:RNA polymerase sigma-70 factor (ECF subfamily)